MQRSSTRSSACSASPTARRRRRRSLSISLGGDLSKFIPKVNDVREKVKEAAHGDWAISRSRQAKLRIAVKYILRKYNYPPKCRKGAVKFVLEQARLTAISIDDDDDDVAPAPAPIQ